MNEKIKTIYKYIDEKDFEKEVNKVVGNFLHERKNRNLWRNNLDIFSALFLSKLNDTMYRKWLDTELVRQIDKNFGNSIGYFHQGIAGKIKDCKRLDKVIDFICKKKKIIAEIKNKQNTVNSDSALQVYDKLNHSLKKEYKNYTSYFVVIIPTTPGNSFNKEFAPSDPKKKKKRPINPKIRIITGNKFYELLTGEKNFLKLIYDETAYILFKRNIDDVDYKKFINQKEFNKFFKKAFG